MADLKISALNSLAGADLVAADVVAVVDDSASETKKLTVSDLIANGVTLISNSTIPSAKILFSAGAIDTAELAASSVETAKINDSAVTAAKLADNSSVTLVSTLPASGSFVGQVAIDTTDDHLYVWDGSSWDSVKAAGSINVVNGSTTGEVNIVASTSGDTVTISATLDDTTAAAQFLAGPTGAGGSVGYRAIIGTDLPTATTSAKGGVIVNGNGLTMSSDTIAIDNTVTAETTENHIVQYDANGLITGGRAIVAADVPNATSTTVGVIKPGSGLGVTGAGELNHDNSVTAGTASKVTFDTEGHITGTESLVADDIPDLDAAKVTTGTFPAARIGTDAITAEKIADKATTTIAENTPAGGEFVGQGHLNSRNGDYLIWDGNVWQPIGISVGQIVLAGTYDASTNLMATVTSEGTALSFVVGSALPAASSSNKGYYVVVSEAGTGTSPAPTVALNPPDFLLSTGTAYTEIDVSDTVTAQQASNVAFTAAGNIAATNVQSAIEELDTEKVAAANPSLTGTVSIGTGGTIQFEGATANDYETTLSVVDPTADRALSLPNVSGTLISSGDTGTVTSTMILDGTIANADISSTAEIAVSKLANGTARQLLQTDTAGTGVEFTSNVDIPGTLDVTGAATLDSTLGVTGLISADGKVKFPAGTASAPSLYSGTDTNTGLYFSAADEVSITTGGTQRVVVDSSGRVLVGASSAASVASNQFKFNVSGESFTDSGTVQVRYGASGGPTAIFANARGTAASPATLQDSDELGKIRFYGHDGTDFANYAAAIQAEVDGTPGSNDMPGRLIFQTTADGASSPTERLRIDSSGNVGIGTSTPAITLDVHGADTSANGLGDVKGQLRIFNDTTAFGSSPRAGIVFSTKYRTSPDIPLDGAAIYGGKENSSDADKDFFLAFATRDESPNEAVERMRIDSSGNVGIGTSSPQSSLSVAGSIPNAPTTEGVHLGLTSNYAVMQLSGNTGGIIDFSEASVDNAGRIIYTHSTDAMQFSTGASTRMTIDSSGNVGIGTTSPAMPLTVKADGNRNSIQIINAGSGTEEGRLYWYASDASTIRGAISGQENGLVFFAGGATERARIDSSGRLLVGTTSAYGSNDNIAIQKTDAGARIGFQHSTTGQVTAGEELGVLTFYSNDGDLNPSASIVAAADLDHAAGDKPGRLVFSTTADGASSETERLRITSTGAWAIEGASNYGTSGQVLTSNGNDSPTWQDASGGGGAWNLVATVNASNAATVDFTSNIDGTYKMYVVVATNVQTDASSANGDVDVQFKNGTSVVTASDYAFVVKKGASNSSTVTAVRGTTQSKMRIFGTFFATSTNFTSGHFEFWMMGNKSSLGHVCYWTGGLQSSSSTFSAAQGCGGLGSNESSAFTVNGVRFKHGGSNISGTFKLYGIS